jgi:hypothetical protein
VTQSVYTTSGCTFPPNFLFTHISGSITLHFACDPTLQVSQNPAHFYPPPTIHSIPDLVDSVLSSTIFNSISRSSLQGDIGLSITVSQDFTHARLSPSSLVNFHLCPELPRSPVICSQQPQEGRLSSLALGEFTYTRIKKNPEGQSKGHLTQYASTSTF